MGACFSRSKGRRPLPSGSIESCVDPPSEPEAPQEETVKEVLSETRRQKDPRASKHEDLEIDKVGGNEFGRDDRSEGPWEGCSLSEGFFVSTSVMEVKGEEQHVPASTVTYQRIKGEDRHIEASPVTYQRKRSSSSAEILLKRERMTGSFVAVGCRSGRTLSPSPSSRRDCGGGEGRMCLMRDASKSAKRCGNTLCRDQGERSERRSLSPAAKPSIGGQCRGVSTVRANGRSSLLRVTGGRVIEGGIFDGISRKTMEQDMVECGGSGATMGSKESLENPLVSLECFIFL